MEGLPAFRYPGYIAISEFRADADGGQNTDRAAVFDAIFGEVVIRRILVLAVVNILYVKEHGQSPVAENKITIHAQVQMMAVFQASGQVLFGQILHLARLDGIDGRPVCGRIRRAGKESEFSAEFPGGINFIAAGDVQNQPLVKRVRVGLTIGRRYGAFTKRQADLAVGGDIGIFFLKQKLGPVRLSPAA